MTCPTCGKEMQSGRLTAGGYWIRFVPDDGVPIADTVTISRLSLSGKGTDACICPNCRKLIADY